MLVACMDTVFLILLLVTCMDTVSLLKLLYSVWCHSPDCEIQGGLTVQGGSIVQGGSTVQGGLTVPPSHLLPLRTYEHSTHTHTW